MIDYSQYPWYHVNKIILDNGLDNAREWHIFGAKDHECPVCKQPPYQACVNLQQKKQYDSGTTALPPKFNKWPHTERVDWNKIETELREQGYE
jgi:hypothetical protein